MTFENILILIILIVTLILFFLETVSIDIIALGILSTLIMSGLITAEQAISNFGNETIVIIVGLLILSASLVRTGVVDMINHQFLARFDGKPNKILLLSMSSVALLSSFMSNTAATALFIPVIMGFTRKRNFSPSKLLLPIAFAAILASSVTLISTSTNIVVSGYLKQSGLPALKMFELTPVGIPILVVGLGYMMLVGRFLLPERLASPQLTDEFGIRSYLTEIKVLPDSPWIGKTLSETGFGRYMDFTVLNIIRSEHRFLMPNPEIRLAPGDVLLLEGNRNEVVKLQEAARISIQPDSHAGDPDLVSKDMHLAEVILLVRSPLIGRTLQGIEFRSRYGLQVLAIHRHETTIHHKLSRVRLRLGDVLLVQGPQDIIKDQEINNTFRILNTQERRQIPTNRAGISIGIFALLFFVSALNLIELPTAIIAATLLIFLTRCITPDEAYREVEWKLVIFIGSMFALGNAMEITGTAKMLAQEIVNFTKFMDPIWLLSGFFLLTMLLTQPMSNQAAAIVVLPIALQVANQMDLNPRTFAVMIAIAASASFITPLEPACLMVYGLGHYKFRDFTRVGLPLTILIYIIAVLLVPLIWPLSI